MLHIYALVLSKDYYFISMVYLAITLIVGWYNINLIGIIITVVIIRTITVVYFFFFFFFFVMFKLNQTLLKEHQYQIYSNNNKYLL